MKLLVCRRCHAEVVMLDDDEFQRVTSLLYYGKGDLIKEKMFSAVLDEFERVAGFREANPNATWHHQVSLYGRPCDRCGKSPRTRAKLCGSCMRPVQTSRI